MTTTNQLCNKHGCETEAEFNVVVGFTKNKRDGSVETDYREPYYACANHRSEIGEFFVGTIGFKYLAYTKRD